MFEEIDRENKELPHLSKLSNRFLGKRKLNIYQIVAIVVLCLGFIGGILLGNMIPSCSTVDRFGICASPEFNISLTLLSWAGVFLFSF